jgi:EAL domain-containing protein (putative c-di-GMP-specific phosphodiesterase class I)/ribosomal protein S18 acetylase RimI-like enzyme
VTQQRLPSDEPLSVAALEADLRGALEKHEFALFYQPQVNALTGDVSGFEALVRWRRPERGLVLPDDFIPVAEATRLIVPLGAWVIEEAARRLAAWREAGHAGTRVAVNLAAAQLADDGIVDHVAATLARHGLEGSQLEVEITEPTAAAEEAVTARVLEALKALGVRLTLDDFGTGHSSALLLVRYPFDTLKIDRSFVMQAHVGVKERAVVAAMISVAHGAGMTVVAEGVETRAQLDLLRQLGADEIQGFFFAAALPAEECGPFLGARSGLPRLGEAPAEPPRRPRGAQIVGARAVTMRPFEEPDWPGTWRIIEPVFRAGETYAVAPDLSEDDARRAWVRAPGETFVAIDQDDTVVGTYYLRPNRPGPGSHLSTCGYIVAEDARGRGIASAMCEHSQREALARGYRAMAYNLVVSTNVGAVRLWQRHGFAIVGTLPQAFDHPRLGLVDAFVMYKPLAD